METKPNRRFRWKRWLVAILALLVIFCAVTLGVFMALEWHPEPLSDTPVLGGGRQTERPPATLRLLSWNIGYAGLGKDADFFMDGGAQVRPPSKALVEENLAAICSFLRNEPADILLLQEVDSDASRSFHLDQVKTIAGVLPNHFYARAVNFKVPWIPYPLLRPIGRVESGLISLSRFRPKKAQRHQLPGSHPWPVRMFHLKRCLHELRLPAPDGHDWVILHLHLSAFDREGRLRSQQMTYLKELVLRLHREGHHLIAGGDWNQAFPGLSERSFPHQARIPEWFRKVPVDWTPAGWQWAYDYNIATLRATNQPYAPGENFVTVVDGFLLSPEVEIRSVRATDLGFTHTDHHPVHLEVSLRGVQAAPD